MKKRFRNITGPDLTPLIDVVFLLLIFFMVSSSLFKKEEYALKLTLPRAKNRSSKDLVRKNQKPSILEISPTDLTYNQKKITIESIDHLIVDKEDPLEVRIDKSVPYERVILILDVLKKFKIYKINLTTIK